MEIKQVHEFVDSAVKQVLGEDKVVTEDLSNLVDIGKDLANRKAVNKFADCLVDRIGKVVFVDRTYAKRAPDIFKTDWEYGNIVQKIDAELPDTDIDEAWELQDGASYDPYIFRGSKVYAKYFGEIHDAFSIKLSIMDKQMFSAFTSATQMGSFYSRIRNKAQNKFNLDCDTLVQNTINNAIGLTYRADIGSANATTTSGIKAVNLLKVYNDYAGTSLTAEQALRNAEFLRFACERISAYQDYLEDYSTLYNIGGRKRFTPKSKQHVIMWGDFLRLTDRYLKTNTFHDEFIKLPHGQLVNKWQGTGDKADNLAFSSLAKIDIKTTNGDLVQIPYRIATIFDTDTLGINMTDYRNVAQRQNLAEFTNYELKYRANHFNDRNENRVIFFRA